MSPLLTWVDVATILRLDKGENDNAERMRKRKILRIMRLAGGVDFGRSEWRVSEEQIRQWVRVNRPEPVPPSPSPVGDGKRHHMPLTIRLRIFDRDKHCVYCGSAELLTIDHVLPVILGGTNEETNLVTACKRCNCVKNGRTPEQAGMSIAFGGAF
jgi:hypothetical protein